MHRDPGREMEETETQGRRQDSRQQGDRAPQAESEIQGEGDTGGETSRQGRPEVGTDGPKAGQTDLSLPFLASPGLPSPGQTTHCGSGNNQA